MEWKGLHSGHMLEQGPVENQCSLHDHGSHSTVPFCGTVTQDLTNQHCSYARADFDYVQNTSLPPQPNILISDYVNYYVGNQSLHTYEQPLPSTSSSISAQQLPSKGTRVLINPNFRPKPLGGNTSDIKMNVHFNPHWRPKIDHSVSSESGKINEMSFPEQTSRLHSASNKKTIHVNPRMLAHINSNAVSCSVSKSVRKEKPLQSSEMQPVSQCNSENASSCCRLGGIMKKSETIKTDQNQAISIPSEAQVEEKVLQKVERKEEKPSVSGLSKLVVISSTKLVRKTEGNSAPPKRILSLSGSAGLGGLTTFEMKQRQSAVSTSVKFAKSLCSKYKYVRSISSSPCISKVVKAQPTVLSRRRKANSSYIVPSSTCNNSHFKYTKTVRRESCTPSLSKYKLVNDAQPPSLEIKSSNVTGNSSITSIKPPTKSRRFSGSHRVVKSRYKLVRGSSPRTATSTSAKPSSNINSRFKLLRVAHAPWAADVKHSKVNTQFKLIRLSSPNNHCKSPKALKTRFKLVRIPPQTSADKHLSKYCIRHGYSGLRENSKFSFIQQPRLSRYLLTSNFKPNRNRMSMSGQYFKLFGNRVWSSQQALEPRQVAVTSRSRLRIGFTPRKNRNSDGTTNKTDKRRSRLINVGGVLYRSTPTTLTRTQDTGGKERVVYVRGKKFVLNRDGTALYQVNHDSASSQAPAQLTIGRLDIGGLTFRRSGSTLVRTNTHKTRNILSQAKFRSIALLTDKLRKNNQPCLIYQRFGKCGALEKGKCWRVHDPKKVAICRKFLQGRCEAEKCFLSHNVGPEKMPTCHHFLEGCCVRDNCPYLHVKLSARTAICRDFLDGYCAAADMCKMRHVYICPDFEREGKCGKGKYCPYPHRVKNKEKRKNVCTGIMEMDKSKLESKPRKEMESLDDSKFNKRTRYYHDKEGKDEASQVGSAGSSAAACLSGKRQRIMKQMSLLKKVRKAVITGEDIGSHDDSVETDTNDSKPDVLEVPLIRPKLGILPAYIPLE